MKPWQLVTQQADQAGIEAAVAHARELATVPCSERNRPVQTILQALLARIDQLQKGST